MSMYSNVWAWNLGILIFLLLWDFYLPIIIKEIRLKNGVSLFSLLFFRIAVLVLTFLNSIIGLLMARSFLKQVGIENYNSLAIIVFIVLLIVGSTPVINYPKQKV